MQLVGPNLSKHLKGVFVTPVPQLSCSLVYDSYEYVDDTMLCATGVDWAGICFVSAASMAVAHHLPLILYHRS